MSSLESRVSGGRYPRGVTREPNLYELVGPLPRELHEAQQEYHQIMSDKSLDPSARDTQLMFWSAMYPNHPESGHEYRRTTRMEFEAG
jgi:hypothetical protein